MRSHDPRPVTGNRLSDWRSLFNGAPETGVLVTVIALALVAACVMTALS